MHALSHEQTCMHLRALKRWTPPPNVCRTRSAQRTRSERWRDMAGDSIRTTHAGSLPRPDDLADMIWAQLDGEEVDAPALEGRIEDAVAEVVAKQREVGLDVISDGEMSKTGFSTYVNERFSGFDGRSEFQADDVADFPELAMRLFNTPSMAHIVFSNCVGPVELSDKDAVHRDIARLQKAIGDADPSSAFMGAISPGQIAFNYPDQHYSSYAH